MKRTHRNIVMAIVIALYFDNRRLLYGLHTHLWWVEAGSGESVQWWHT